MQPAINIIPFPVLPKSFTPPTESEVALQCLEIGLPEREGCKFVAYFQSVNWVVGRSRKPMASWKGALRTWKFNYDDRQQVSEKPSASVESIKNQKEYQRVIERMKTILCNYGDAQTWTESDREEYRELRARRNELKTILGITI